MQFLSKLTTIIGAQEGKEVIPASEYAFMSFLSEHNRMYGTKAEYEFRLGVFQERLAEIEAFNAVPGQTSTVGINKFADYTSPRRR